MAQTGENPKLILDDGILSGGIRNCFIRLNTVPDTVALEIFFPKSADEDRWEIRDFLNEPYIVKKEWVDSGLRLLLKGIPPKKLWDKCRPLTEKIVTHFSKKYPDDVFKRYKHYICGKLSRVIFLHINQTVVIKYCEELRADFTKNFCKVIFSETGNLEKVFINCYEEGTLEFKNGQIEMHRWENEDEAQSASYLSRRYTQRLLNGVINEPDTKNRMIKTIRSSMDTSAIEGEDCFLFNRALTILENNT